MCILLIWGQLEIILSKEGKGVAEPGLCNVLVVLPYFGKVNKGEQPG